MGYANTEIFKTTGNYQFVFYNSKSFWNDNLGNYGKNHCKGLAKINKKNLFNKYPKIKESKQKLYDSGAIYSSMTGTGSAVYGIFKKS